MGQGNSAAGSGSTVVCVSARDSLAKEAWRKLNACNSFATGVWRNGSASDSRSEGWEFESLCPHYFDFPCAAMCCAHSSPACKLLRDEFENVAIDALPLRASPASDAPKETRKNKLRMLRGG